MDKKVKLIKLMFIFFVVKTLVGISPEIYSQDFDIKAKQIFNRFISACGGEELEKIKTEKRVGTLIKGKAGKVPFTSVSNVSGKWMYNQVFAFGDQVRYGFDGHSAWVSDKKGVSEIDNRELLDLRILFDIQFPFCLNRLFSEMKVKKCVKEADKDHIILVVRTRDNLQIELAFDEKSGFLTRAGDIYFSDYKKTGNIIRPHKIFIGHDQDKENLRLMMEVQNISFNEPVNEKMFTPSLCPLIPTQSPLYTRRKQITVSDEILESFVGEYKQVDNPEKVFLIKRQDNHLMMKTPRSPYFIEIKPEAELDYFIRFLNIEVHFEKNSQGDVVRLKLGPGHKLVAEKLNSEKKEIK